jgi:hypothetical protein
VTGALGWEKRTAVGEDFESRADGDLLSSSFQSEDSPLFPNSRAAF